MKGKGLQVANSKSFDGNVTTVVQLLMQWRLLDAGQLCASSGCGRAP